MHNVRATRGKERKEKRRCAVGIVGNKEIFISDQFLYYHSAKLEGYVNGKKIA